MKVLVTGAGSLLGQGIIRALRESALRPRIVAVDPCPHAVGLYWADARYVVPMAHHAGYIAALREVLDRERPDTLLVGTDAELPALARHRRILERDFQTKVLVSSPGVIAIANDKYLTFRFLRSHGFDPPACGLPGQEAELIDQVGFPLIVKPRVGARSVGVVRVANWAELTQALQQRDDVVIQEYVGHEQQEFTAAVVSFEGRCRASIVMRRDLKDGNTVRAYVDNFEDLNVRVREMAEALQPYGPANFQFRMTGERLRCFEINARFSGTVALRRFAGFHDVEMCLEYILHGRPVEQPETKSLAILRYMSECLVPCDQLLDACESAPAQPVMRSIHRWAA